MKPSIVDPNAGTYFDTFMQLDILRNGSRELIVDWLEWNDINGVYSDHERDAEGLPRLTLETARDAMQAALSDH